MILAATQRVDIQKAAGRGNLVGNGNAYSKADMIWMLTFCVINRKEACMFLHASDIGANPGILLGKTRDLLFFVPVAGHHILTSREVKIVPVVMALLLKKYFRYA